MPDYVNKVAGIAGNYEFPYPILFWTARLSAWLIGAKAAMAVTTALFNLAAVIITKYYMNREIRKSSHYETLSHKKQVMTDIVVTLLVFALFLLSNLYSPKNTAFFGFDYAYRCMGIYTPNPFWTKPSFTMVVVPLIGLILLVQLIVSRGESFRNAFRLCVTMIPTGIALLYQFSGIFTGTNAMGEETGIAIGFAKVWSNYSKSIPLSIVMGMALPIGVLCLNLLFDLKSIKQNRYYWFAWLSYLTATLMFLVFYEKGFRMMHANFSWGYMHGMFFVFLMTLIVMMKNIREWWKSWKVIFVVGELAVLLYHLVCGVNFLMYAVMGNDLAGF